VRSRPRRLSRAGHLVPPRTPRTRCSSAPWAGSAPWSSATHWKRPPMRTTRWSAGERGFAWCWPGPR